MRRGRRFQNAEPQQGLVERAAVEQRDRDTDPYRPTRLDEEHELRHHRRRRENIMSAKAVGAYRPAVGPSLESIAADDAQRDP